MKSRLANSNRTVYVAITALGVAFAYGVFWWGGQGLFWDSLGYYTLGERIAREGLFAFGNSVRTFAYPLFIAVAWLVSNHLPSTVRFLVFNFQLIIYLGTSLLGAKLIERSFHSPRWGLAFFAAAALNPFTLIYTALLLSDLLSAVCVFLAVAFSVWPNSSENKDSGGLVQRAFLSCLFAGLAAMVRPGSVSLVVGVALIWLLRRLVFAEGGRKTLTALLLGIVIPFTPQLAINYQAYHQIQPLVVHDLYSDGLMYGLKYLKVVGIVIPGQARAVPYANPFFTPDLKTPVDFVTRRPLEFVATQFLHLFVFFDQDFPFPFIYEIHPWYRWPVAILDSIFLFMAFAGALAWIRKVARVRCMDSEDLVLAGMLIGALIYIPLHILISLEVRYSLPEFLLLTPFFLYGLDRIRSVVREGRWKPLAFQVAALGIFAVSSGLISNWVQGYGELELPTSQAERVRHDVNLRFGNGVELTAFAVDPSQIIQGGTLLYVAFDWECNGASTELYEVQLNLADGQGHSWSQAIHDTHNPISPCVAAPWGPGEHPSDLVTFRLPPTIPSGDYEIVAAILDPARGQYLDSYDATGMRHDGAYAIWKLAVDKNKQSFTASDLTIEQPYFVDMGEMRFLGYTELTTEVRAGAAWSAGLYWRARGKPAGDYEAVLQLRDPAGKVILEDAARPAKGTYPTTQWNAGEVLLDWHDVSLPSQLAAGEYDVFVLMRELASRRILGETKISTVSILP